MSRSAGTGSPVWFRCYNDRRGVGIDHVVALTGRTRPSRSKRYSTKGTRSDEIAREYRCSCGHVGWSNHMDLEGWSSVKRHEHTEQVTPDRADELQRRAATLDGISVEIIAREGETFDPERPIKVSAGFVAIRVTAEHGDTGALYRK